MHKGNRILFEALRTWLGGRKPAPELLDKIADPSTRVETADGASTATLGYLLSELGALDKLPKEKAREIGQFRHFIAANTTAMMLDLDVVLERTKKIGVAVLLLKGTALVKSGVYPKKGMRMLSDIDVLIAKPDIPAFEKLLDDCGWKTGDYESELHEEHHLPLRIGPRGFPLEVHFALSRLPAGLDGEKIRSRATPLPGNDFALIPAIEDTLIQLALNTALHHPEKIYTMGIKFVVDFAFAWKRFGDSIDWEYISGILGKTGLGTPFWNVVLIADRLISPPGLSAIISKYGADKIADSMFVKVVVEKMLEGAGTEELSWLVVLAAEEKNLLRRIFKMFRAVFPPLSYMKENYPAFASSPKIVAAYPLRIYNILKRTSFKNALAAYRAGKSARHVGFSGDDTSS